MKVLKRMTAVMAAGALLLVGNIGILPESVMEKFAIEVSAAGTIVASGKCGAEGNNLTWTLDENGVLTISGNGEMADYESDMSYYASLYSYYTTSPWKRSWSNINTIVIEEGVNYIGNYAFYKCSNLESIEFPDSLVSIGEFAFASCTNLDRIKLPSGINTIERSAFSNCQSVTNVEFSEGLVSIGDYAFYSCTSLESIIFPKTLTTIGECAFSNSSNLQSVELPDSLSSIGYRAFYNDTSLATINIPKTVSTFGGEAFNNTIWLDGLKEEMTGEPIIINSILIDASSVTGTLTISSDVKVIGDYAANGNSNLTDVIIPDSVTSIGNHAFYECEKLTNISIPDSIIDIGNYAFYGCVAAEKITIGDGVVKIGENAFRYCDAAKTISLGNSLSEIGEYAFCGCNSITEITIPANVSTIGDQAFCTTNLENIDVANENQYYTSSNGILFNKKMTELVCCPVAKGYESYSIPSSVEKIGSYAVYNNSSLKNVTIPSSVTEIGKNAFEYCEKLQSITIPDSVTSVGEKAFYHCNSLQEAYVGSGIEVLPFDIFGNCTGLKTVELSEGLKTLSRYAFVWCRSLESITIPDNVETIGSEAFWCCLALKEVHLGSNLKEIGKQAFYQCHEIENINIPEGVESIGYQAFYECSSIKEIVIPQSVQTIEGGMNQSFSLNSGESTLVSHGAFASCTGLEKVIFNGEISTISEGLFYNCSNLKTILLPDSLKTIDDYAFAGCSNLETLVLPNTLRYINESAFSGCSSLRNISFPSELYRIGKRAFYNCLGLTDIVLPDNVERIDEEAFAGCVNLISTYIPESVTSIGANAFMTYSTNAKYNYELFALSDVGANLYNGVTAKLYIRTENPDPDSFYIATNMPHQDSSSTYDDIEYKDPDDEHKIKAVNGGYIWVFDPEVSGNFECMIVEKNEDGKSIIAEHFDLTVNDYDTAYYEWMDEVIASQTTDSMTNFEKMEAISKYLRSTFKYLTNDGNGYLTSLASVPNSPYFAAHRWDSYISPSGLGQFALRIGGFDKVESLYSSYASYGFSWSNGHYLCYCEANGEGRFYEACPLSGTGAVESFTIDFSDASQLYTVNGMKKNNAVYQPLTIYGISASTAETYATENDITFIAIAADVQGDINADGKFDVADIVLLQKWLLAVPGTNLSNWKNGNFYEDDRLDGVDLCLMKRALIQQQN